MPLNGLYLEAAEDLRSNAGQWQAYDSQGHCIIIAGPGSGKTKTLTVKIARLLSEEIKEPRGIACVTYSNECARELRARLTRLGIEESRRVFIGTVHGFCLKNLLIPYAHLAALSLPLPITLASAAEQRQAFAAAVEALMGVDEPPTRWRTVVERHRRVFFDRSNQSGFRSDSQLASLAEEYEARLRARGLIDFDGVVRFSVHLLSDIPWVLRAIEARFPVFVVDEYQDLAPALHTMVRTLCRQTRVRVIAVGDPDQSIYGFAGATPELLGDLAELPGAEVVRLRLNYRSGKRIVDASEFALGESRGYEARGAERGSVDFYRCPDGFSQQVDEVFSHILPSCLQRRAGRRLGDVAILYLDKNEGDVIAESARRASLSFIRIDSGAPYGRTPLTRWLEDCAAWCAGGWRAGVPRLSSIVSRWLAFNPTTRGDRAIHRLTLALTKFLFAQRDPSILLSAWLAGLRDTCLNVALVRERTLGEELEALARLETACGDGAPLSRMTISTFGCQSGDPDHLNLITLHSAKGLEFDVVVLPGMDQGRLPRWDARTVAAKREARRLFYVGLTRAKQEAHLLFSGWVADRYGNRRVNGTSEFLLEVQSRLQQTD